VKGRSEQFREVIEGSARVLVSTGAITKRMEAFYNPIMEFNRSVTILFLNSVPQERLIVGLPMAATGVRGIRILKEVKKRVMVHFNDKSEIATKIIKRNLKLNKLSAGFTVSNLDASIFMLGSKGFSYLDIDPFGTPSPFLDSAVRRVSRQGYLGVTATDTAPLAGTYPKACLRNYWAMPVRNEFMHETGLRILIRKVQLIASQFDKALEPVFSYYRDHYYRVFFRARKSKSAADGLLKQHGWLAGCRRCLRRYHSITPAPSKCECGAKLNYAGPLWLGKLWDTSFVERMLKHADSNTKQFLSTIYEESKVNAIGFYTLGMIGKVLKLSELPKKHKLIEKLNKAGYKASPTHFSPEGVAIRGNPQLKPLLL